MIALLAAPTNLGLRPPHPSSVPGTAKAPEAFRETGLFARFTDAGARDAGVVLPGRYADDATPGRLRNQDAIVEHARRLARRVAEIRAAGDVPLVFGGDCSLVVGVGLALRPAGRFALVHLDGHTDFRNPGNSDACAALAGEDLAAAIGRHWPAIADVDGLGPYFDPADTVHAGCRDDDQELAEVEEAISLTIPASAIIRDGAAATADRVRERVERADLDGYWLHLDVDILDATVMPAVDSPDPGGLLPDQLTELLAALAPGAAGAHVAVFDPDLDPDGRHARLLTDIVTDGLGQLGTELKPAAAHNAER
ncbi:Arginase/agmatinase/formiminoglutamase [Catenulispora acidiphila DSM 44928]|uniref:Arginase/agmatinase/formiminoglutamase n=1 Tax=Catenulispora acidiphila (strain DSM 44928 / JCM 14897 / NBRC 102108 / NRRL B-24433 / ID139908) TaxID=479433 RepID=C7QKM3_CATAD|nr:arginase family protein [Catenulispora acidiphila]ACU77122.1 Arginase/agmatinase/formiminoglutamase [Catenulispora acidiphila DSM 44928]